MLMKARRLRSALRLTAITADGAWVVRSYRARVREWLQAGVRAIQLREKSATPASVYGLGRYLRSITAEYDALLIVNDDPELARELNADGCHLGREDMPIGRARRILGEDKIIGLSTHNEAQVREAVALGADYIGVGPVFRTTTKRSSNPLVEPEFAGWAAQHAGVPAVAIGGINLCNVDQLVQAGCSRVAVVSALNAASRPGELARAMLDILESVDPADLPR